MSRHTAPHFASQLIVKEEPHTDSIRQCVAPIRVEDTPIRVDGLGRYAARYCLGGPPSKHKTSVSPAVAAVTVHEGARAELTDAYGVRNTTQTELLAALPHVVDSLARGERAARDAAVGITTTDLAFKSTALTLQLGGQEVRLGGCVKGSGMIHPNMATMLGVVTCDAAVDPLLWRQMVAEASTNSFNQVRLDLRIVSCIFFHSSMSSSSSACSHTMQSLREVPDACPGSSRSHFVMNGGRGADHRRRRHVHERLRGGHGQRLRRQRQHSQPGQC